MNRSRFVSKKIELNVLLNEENFDYSIFIDECTVSMGKNGNLHILSTDASIYIFLFKKLKAILKVNTLFTNLLDSLANLGVMLGGPSQN